MSDEGTPMSSNEAREKARADLLHAIADFILGYKIADVGEDDEYRKWNDGIDLAVAQLFDPMETAAKLDPALAAYASSLSERNERLERALRKYGKHPEDCNGYAVYLANHLAEEAYVKEDKGRVVCDCGLLAAITEAASALEGKDSSKIPRS